MKYKLVTIKFSKVFDNYEYKIFATQEYNAEYNGGHWKYFIQDFDENILKIQSSCCAPPEGKIDRKFLEEEINKFYREYRRRNNDQRKI